jgi:hypothetical protein
MQLGQQLVSELAAIRRLLEQLLEKQAGGS